MNYPDEIFVFGNASANNFLQIWLLVSGEGSRSSLLINKFFVAGDFPLVFRSSEKILMTLEDGILDLNFQAPSTIWKIYFWPIIVLITGASVNWSELGEVAKFWAWIWTKSCANFPKIVKLVVPLPSPTIVFNLYPFL